MSTMQIGNQDGTALAEAETPATALTWRALTTAHGRLAHELTAVLQKQHGLSLNAQAVLAQLVRAPGHKLRMTEIAHLIDFSLSGLTGLVGRLERDGLIERQSNVADRRVIYACLTESGERSAIEAERQLRASLESTLGERLSPAELATLTDLLRRITPTEGRLNGKR